MRHLALISALATLALARVLAAASAPVVDVGALAPLSEIRVTTAGSTVTIEWPVGASASTAIATFDLAPEHPLIASLATRARRDASPRLVGHDLEPTTTITVGQRDLARNGWMVFFDKVNTRPSQRFPVKRALTAATATSTTTRAQLTLTGVRAGAFSGQLVFTFYSGSAFFQAETVLHTAENSRALLYDTGLVSAPGQITRYTWVDPKTGALTHADLAPAPAPTPAPAGSASASATSLPTPLPVKHRVVIAETATGAIAAFPAPHRFLYPLDFADNFGFTWAGRDQLAPGDGFGVRQPPDGDKRFVPWVNAPPGTDQRLGVFYLVSDAAPAALAAVKRLTHDDHYVALPGYKTFTSHFHVEHTLTLLKAQAAADNTTEIPADLRTPGFVRALRGSGVDIVHLAEFHNGQTPKLAAAPRLAQLRTLHAECARLSDEDFLLLPGEEPNVHLGGHWISFFPRPVNWILHRGPNEPFEEKTPAGETIYRVGSPADILTLMERENGLMWTAHARIKSSIGFPDAYRHEPFFNSPHFLGAAWKAMPADYSRPTLGWRVLDLFDDMNNWGAPKQVLGEVDVFKIEPDYELYGAMNINYVKLDRLPRFTDGWQPVLDVLRRGDFFVTTGEILFTNFSVNGAGSALPAPRNPAATVRVRAQLDWTFPLAFAEIVAGDGVHIHRQRIDLSTTKSYGTQLLDETLPAKNWRWVRLEVWDIAANGAFTQPVHLN